MCGEAKEDPCKRTSKRSRSSTNGMKLAGIAREHVKSEHDIDIVLESCVPVMQVPEGWNGAGYALHIAVHSDMERSGNMRCALCIAAQFSYEEGRDMRCDSRNANNIEKDSWFHEGIAGFMKVVLHALLDKVQVVSHGCTWSSRSVTRLKFVALDVMPGTGSSAQDGPLRTDFSRAGVV